MPDNPSFLERHHFLLRRLHSLTGIVPIGLFLILHLTTNSSIVWGSFLGDSGVAMFQHEVDFIHSLPALVLIEIFGLWLPIAFHSILGVYYAVSGSTNTKSYRYGGNFRYALQRISGYVGVIFIFYHVATLRWGWSLPGAYLFDAHAASSTTAMALRAGSENPWQLAGILVGLFYLLSVLLLVYHFANGLWTAAITWGLTISEQGQRRWGYVCASLGAALMVMGVTAVVGFVTLDIEEARQIEASLHTAQQPAVETTLAPEDNAH